VTIGLTLLICSACIVLGYLFGEAVAFGCLEDLMRENELLKYKLREANQKEIRRMQDVLAFEDDG